MKRCGTCKREKALSEFHTHRTRGYQSRCKPCAKLKANEWRKTRPESLEKWKAANADSLRKRSREWQVRWRKENPEASIWAAAKRRAKVGGVPFEIAIDDIVIPTHCPILGIKLVRSIGNGSGNFGASPSLDRILPDLGYVRGNVAVISARANSIKNNASAELLRRVADWIDANAPKKTR